MQSDHWKIVTDPLHVLLLAAGFAFAIAGCILYFHMIAKLQAVGEPVPGIFERKDVFRVLRRYRDLAAQYSWSTWLVKGYWIALFFASVCALAFVYWR